QVRRAGEETLRVVSRAVNDPALALDLQSQRARALAEAYLRAGMCFYAASDLPQARIYLKQALRLAPGLLADGRFLRTALTAQLGTRLIERLRRWRPAPHRTGSDRGV
ncbi:MAG: tetratricopeptide repeat protein, partial [Anaerolineae bacterium]